MSWQVKSLSEVCDFQRGLTYAKGDEVAESGNIVLRANNVDLNTNQLDLSELRHIRKEIAIPESKKVKQGSLIVCTASGSKSHLGKVALVDRDYGYAFGGFMGQITPKPGLHPKYLFHIMTSKGYKDFIDGLSDGANINNLKFDDLGKFDVSFPELAEQRRIVALLDEAFAGIATAKTNAEKNLRNAEEVFDNKIRAVYSDGAWSFRPLGDVCDNLDSRRIPVTKKDRASGDVPYYGASGVVDHVARHIFDEDLLLVSEDGANLLARTYPIAFSISGKSWVNNHAHVLQFKNIDFQRLVEYYLNSIPLDEYVSGMAQPKLNQKLLNAIPVPAPSAKESQAIVAKLDTLRTEVSQLQSIYTRKLAALAELRQSLLQRAFSGQL